MTCQDCATGEISNPGHTQCIAAPICDGADDILGDESNCFQCNTCT